MAPTDTAIDFRHAAPFWASLIVIPLVFLSATYGGWAIVLPLAGTWWAFSALDRLLGRNTDNPDPNATDAHLYWYSLITWVWLPIQIVTLYTMIAWIPRAEHLVLWEKFGVFLGVGVMSGSIGIVYAHELMHQKDRFERWLADLLLASVLYSHFRTEHLLVHHPWVGTRRDAVSARYNEGFHRYFFRVLREGLVSAWRAERAMLARRDLSPWDGANPFWRYWALQGGALLLALVIGGWLGLALFLFQAFVAIWQLELTNYVEHYGLVRKYMGDGKYEPVRPHHSWNADHMATNWLLINLQRHSDHHYKPARRFPLLQTYEETQAPQLPFGYPVMAMAAMVPPVWRRMMNPRVRHWRRQYYPEIEDWGPYKRGEHPVPGPR
ncbi:alkane 1-monooxygenase [Maritimibacter sp. UBA3975]|uniref:alkane 1-monooxygenase n=1 Tax=Maritimibacter sp. UBA3975 TaxID=1946833 RepID=UPI000C0A256F|nr:alkane 1-monooxygenase [Maritimibacter sp. UBA3975]MAM63232.1 alkane 1-monooxygenase [Maritimibacter sp.]|tara:strand:- start:11575 stop:12714 length:1140 start_codon:yes stop_codon:yes gene_type:complete